MVSTLPTDYWNDSCSIHELTYAIEHGAVGATTNPTIVVEVLKKEMPLWRDRIKQIISENPTWSENQITWQVIEEIALKGAELLYPVFEHEHGVKGRLSIQTNPANYRDPQAILEQAIHFNSLAANLQVKIPATKAGIAAIEDATYLGININATVSFSVSQAAAVAEAVESGLARREKAGHSIKDMSPVCTLMVGRLDDWMQILSQRDGIVANPEVIHWAGVAAMKKAYEVYQKNGYRTRLLAAAYRHQLHWSELMGGDIVQTIPYNWAVRFNASDIKVENRFQNPVSDDILDELLSKFPDFRRAYEPNGLDISEFDSFGPTVRTLRSFISSYHDLVGMIREFMLPNPDVLSN